MQPRRVYEGTQSTVNYILRTLYFSQNNKHNIILLINTTRRPFFMVENGLQASESKYLI